MLTMPMWANAASVVQDCSYTDTITVSPASGETGFTFAGRSIGAADDTRLVVVAVHFASFPGANIVSATIGGVTATILGVSNAATIPVAPVSAYARTALVAALVPAGTTADIVVGFSAVVVRAGIGVYRLVGLSSTTPHDLEQTAGLSVLIDVPTDGIVIAASTGPDGITHTWTNATERYDAALGTSNMAAYTGAMTQSLSLQSNRSVSVAPSSGASAQGFIAATFT